MSSLFQECVRTAQSYNPKHSQRNGYRHYSFIVQSDKILGWDTNHDGPCLYGYKPYQKTHAENNAYFKCKTFLDKKKPFTVINIRLNKQGNLRMSAPCNCCVAWLRKLKCATVYFSVSDNIGFAKIKI